MKVIEALKKIKSNREKIQGLTVRVSEISAYMESQEGKLPIKDPAAKIREYTQSVLDISNDNAKLLSRVQKTNLETALTLELPINGKTRKVTKSVSEWVARRREGIEQETNTWANMTSKRLTPKLGKDENGTPFMDNVVLAYDQEERDTRIMELREEVFIIDAALEISNATNDLLEL